MRTTLRGVIIQGGLSRQRSHLHVQLADLRALILPGIYLTARGRDVAGYHLFVAVAGLALLGTVHFAPTAGQESPIHDIYMVYESPVAGMLALMILAGLMTSVALLAITAFVALRRRAGGRAIAG